MEMGPYGDEKSIMRTLHRCLDDVKVNITKIGYEVSVGIEVAQNRVQYRALFNIVMKFQKTNFFTI
jgi:hypothetical protein